MNDRGIVQSGEGMERLRGLLTVEEVKLLMLVLVEDETQQAIADRAAVPRTTIESRIAVAVRKLTTAGINVMMPRPGRRRTRPDVANVDPSDMDRMTTGRNSSGQLIGRWIDANQARQASNN